MGTKRVHRTTTVDTMRQLGSTQFNFIQLLQCTVAIGWLIPPEESYNPTILDLQPSPAVAFLPSWLLASDHVIKPSLTFWNERALSNYFLLYL